MKVVIDIDKKSYDKMKTYHGLDDAYFSIKHGIPLDDIFAKIRAKIEEYKATIDRAVSEDKSKIKGMKEAYADCLEIIDKHLSEVEGEDVTCRQTQSL